GPQLTPAQVAEAAAAIAELNSNPTSTERTP
ncbi:MAG: hypothetical protein JWP07_3475, partial [Pseudonocardiales bacterium]|nr:hypothetical protein [Pseudonocardiales bacterium]